MITVISGSNRRNSNSKKIATEFSEILEEAYDGKVHFYSLDQLPTDFVHPDMYSSQHADIVKVQDTLVDPASKLVFVVPEYNGTFSGIFKIFIDALSVRNAENSFYGKKVLLIGLGSGRGGNLRGLDHLTTSLNYMKMHIHPNRLPISNVDNVIDESGKITIPGLREEMEKLAKAFVEF